jgi:hypothetical protein
VGARQPQQLPVLGSRYSVKLLRGLRLLPQCSQNQPTNKMIFLKATKTVPLRTLKLLKLVGLSLAPEAEEDRSATTFLR